MQGRENHKFKSVLFLATFLISLATPAAENKKNCPSLLESFSDLRKNREIYKPSYCHQNIHNILSQLKAHDPGFDISQADVIYVFAQSEKGLLVPLVPVEYKGGWFYHVALRYKDQVFDPDQQEPTPAKNMREYLKRMFVGTDEERAKRVKETKEYYKDSCVIEPLDRVLVRSIPASEYLADLWKADELGVRDTLYYRALESKYRTNLLQDFLNDSEE